MTWRGTTTVKDRIFASLPYLLPLVEGLGFGISLFREFPALVTIFQPAFYLLRIYRSIPFAGIVIFFALFMLVVRNENIAHFIRFNTMQAILLDIVLILCGLLVPVLSSIPGSGFAMQTLTNTIFIGLVAAVIYSIVQTFMGRYAEIPAISDAVYMQVR